MDNTVCPVSPISLDAKPALKHMSVGQYDAPFLFHAGWPDLWLLHLHFTQIECCYRGQNYTILPSQITLFPPEQRYYVSSQETGRHTWYSCHFSLPPAPSSSVGLPIINDCGTHFDTLSRAFERALGFWATNPVRAEIVVWEMLWQLADFSQESRFHEKPRHPALERALQIIEQRLHDPLSVHAIAAEVDVSHNHLTRLFHTALGCTVIHYIQQRRVSRAEYLLKQTSQPLKVIATEVGLSNPQVLNKVIRRHTGKSPIALRHQS